jgi:hypothetical protein
LLLGGGVVLLVGGALVPATVRARTRRRRLAAVAAGGPDAAGAGWAELLDESSDRGVPSKDSDTVRAAARRLVREHHLDGTAQQHLRGVVGVVEASWYGGQHPAGDTLTEPLSGVLSAVAASTPLSVRDRLLPRSVLRRPPRRARTHDNAATPGARSGGVGSGVSEQSDAIPARTGGGSAPPSGP